MLPEGQVVNPLRPKDLRRRCADCILICSTLEQNGDMIEYKLIRELEKNPNHTQRSLAGTLNVSLGKANYVLAGLVEKGLIRAKRLRNHPGRIKWQYVLTPKGMKEKLRITRTYLRTRMYEFDRIGREIAELKQEVGALSDQGDSRAS